MSLATSFSWKRHFWESAGNVSHEHVSTSFAVFFAHSVSLVCLFSKQLATGQLSYVSCRPSTRTQQTEGKKFGSGLFCHKNHMWEQPCYHVCASLNRKTRINVSFVSNHSQFSATDIPPSNCPLVVSHLSDS